MAFFEQAITVLQTLVIALGAGLGIWGVINLLEGYGNDNPGAKSQGMKQLMAGAGVAVVGMVLVPLLSGLFSVYGSIRVGDRVTLICEKSENSNGDATYTVVDYVFYPQLGVKLCSMAGGGVQKSIWCFLENRPGGTGQAVTCSTSGMGLRLK